MSSQPVLPFETMEMVIDNLAQDDPGLSSLKTCALVCPSFLELCRKHIFASITMHHRHKIGSPKSNAAALVRMLYTTPEIAYYIRNLHWLMEDEEFEDPSLPGILKKITKLESLAICWCSQQWRENALRSSILHLLHLPTLLRLKLSDIQDFVFADLIPCANLRKLEIEYVEPVENVACSFRSTLSHEPSIGSLTINFFPLVQAKKARKAASKKPRCRLSKSGHENPLVWW